MRYAPIRPLTLSVNGRIMMNENGVASSGSDTVATCTPARRLTESPNSSRNIGNEPTRDGFTNRARNFRLRPRRESNSDDVDAGRSVRVTTLASARSGIVSDATAVTDNNPIATPKRCRE